MEKDYQYITRWAKTLKAIEYLGGKCCKCGEDDPVLLEFHHRDKTNKKEDVSRILGSWVFKECIQELNRCILLCVKCHRREHFNYTRFENLIPLIKDKMITITEKISRKKNYEVHKNEVISMLKGNKSYREITKKTGITRNAIRNLAMELGIDRSEFTNRLNINEDKFVEIYNTGTSYPEMCKIFNMSKFPLNRIKNKLIKEGRIIPRKGKPSKIIRSLT